LAAQTVEQEIKALWDKYDKAKEEYEQEYLDLIETNANSLKTRYDNAVAQINSLNDLLDNLKSKVDAATEANKRMVMEASQKDYYRL
jgi:non-homologous end joining protein Ku